MELVKKLPLMPSGRVDMTAHYSACRQTTDFMAVQIITESDQQRGRPDLWWLNPRVNAICDYALYVPL
jgi:hypothetical protein